MEVGITELKEAVVGINEISIFLINRFKDGVQAADFIAFWEKMKDDADFKKIVEDAFKGVSAIPVEIKDITLTEGLELATVQLSYIPRIVEAFKA